MLKKFITMLENPKRPLLGPNVKALKFWGLILPENIFKRYFYFFMHLAVTLFTATEYVDMWFIKSNMNLLLINMKITMLATMSVVKITTFLIWQKKWLSIIEYVTEADIIQRRSDDKFKNDIIHKYTKYSRTITFMYWMLMYTTVVIVVFTPIFKYFLSPTYRLNVLNGTDIYLQVVSSWVPFDKSTMIGLAAKYVYNFLYHSTILTCLHISPGYLAASAYQTYAAIYGGGWITSFDTNAMVIMVFFKGELEMLRRDSSFIHGTNSNPISDKEYLRRLKDCRRRHVRLVRFARLFDYCLSPIMLLYMFVCSVMLCVTAYQITIETSAMQRFLTTEYLVFGIAQLFMYCWHSNDVLFASQDLMLGPYEGSWWNNNVKNRKNLYILTAQFRKSIVFSAGPFNKLTVATFIGILKGAYSYYTLLSQSQMK